MSETILDEHGEPLELSTEGTPDIATEGTPLPVRPDRAGGKDLLKVLGIVWSAEIVTAIVTIIVSTIIGGEPLRPGSHYIDRWAVWAMFSLSSTILIWACWRYACAKYGRSFRDGLYLVPVSRVVLGTSVSLGLVASAVGITVAHFSPAEELSMMAELFVRPSADHPGAYEIVYPMLLLPVMAAVVEEIYYRGFLYAVFDRLLGANWALVIIIAWFWLLHVPQIGNYWAGLASVMVGSVVLTLLRRKYGSIWPSIVCHVTYNGILMLTMAFSGGQE